MIRSILAVGLVGFSTSLASVANGEVALKQTIDDVGELTRPTTVEIDPVELRLGKWVSQPVRLAYLEPRSFENSAGSEEPSTPVQIASGSRFSTNSFLRSLFACDEPRDRLWSFEFGVAVISDNTISDYADPKLNKFHGPGAGLTYNFTVTRRVKQFAWNIGPFTLRPELEVPARLTLVDENTGRLIPDLNVGLALRWRDFPWNRLVRTTLAAGPGLSSSFQPWTADISPRSGCTCSRITGKVRTSARSACCR